VSEAGAAGGLPFLQHRHGVADLQTMWSAQAKAAGLASMANFASSALCDATNERVSF
jgi:hypothetical protein